MSVDTEFVERYAKLKRQQEERDDLIKSVTDKAKKRSEEISADYGNIDTEIGILRNSIQREIYTRRDETYTEEIPGVATVEIRWLPKVEIVEVEELIDWLCDHDRESLYERKVEFKKAQINKIVEGLTLAGLPLPDGVKRQTEATLYITLEKV